MILDDYIVQRMEWLMKMAKEFEERKCHTLGFGFYCGRDELRLLWEHIRKLIEKEACP